MAIAQDMKPYYALQARMRLTAAVYCSACVIVAYILMAYGQLSAIIALIYILLTVTFVCSFHVIIGGLPLLIHGPMSIVNHSWTWFMWRGPIVRFDIKSVNSARRYLAAKQWLRETYDCNQYKELDFGVIKFKHASIAVMFKLMCD